MAITFHFLKNIKCHSPSFVYQQAEVSGWVACLRPQSQQCGPEVSGWALVALHSGQQVTWAEVGRSIKHEHHWPLSWGLIANSRVDKGIVWLIPEAFVEAEMLLGRATAPTCCVTGSRKSGREAAVASAAETASMAQTLTKEQAPSWWLLLQTQPPPRPGCDGQDHVAPGC